MSSHKTIDQKIHFSITFDIEMPTWYDTTLNFFFAFFLAHYLSRATSFELMLVHIF